MINKSLSDRKSPFVTGILFSNLADLNKAVLCMVLTCTLISKSSSPLSNSLVTKEPNNCNWYDYYFHFLYIFTVLARST